MTFGTFEILENGIYKTYWHKTTPEGMKAYAEWFFEHYNELPSGSVMRILHDYRETATPPFKRLREAMSDFNMRNDVTLRVAHIYSDSLYPVLMRNATLISGMSANRKFFTPGQEADAIKWLLQ